jgi:hypothetical protein
VLDSRCLLRGPYGRAAEAVAPWGEEKEEELQVGGRKVLQSQVRARGENFDPVRRQLLWEGA